jgi:hypothetical protein
LCQLKRWLVLIADKLMPRQEKFGLSREDLTGLTGKSDITWLVELIASDASEVQALHPISLEKKVYETPQVNMLDVLEIECLFCRGDQGPRGSSTESCGARRGA